jgi:hypothetical protein
MKNAIMQDFAFVVNQLRPNILCAGTVPGGEGFPGWHIEMLGDEYQIPGK